MQTQIRDSAPVSIGGIITIGQTASTQMQTRSLSASQPIITRMRPPYTTPIRWPHEIVSEYLSFQELQSWIGFIQTKQKTNGEWEDIRKKMPPELLEKTAKVLKNCRKNGFINPRVNNGKLAWSQILGREVNRKYNCECDLCDNNMTKGDCKGSFVKNKEGHRDFKPCWK